MAERTVAAFDFDGTITRRDTFVPFLIHAAGPGRIARLCARELPLVVRVAAGRGDRDALKQRAVGALAGRTHSDLSETGIRFAERITRERMRSEMLARIEWHRSEGHELAIVSASLDLYLTPIAERLGIATVLCTTLEYDAHGVATGNLVHGNCWGPEKLRRLQARFGTDGYTLHAYGDSAGDRDLLGAADHPTWISDRAIRIR